MFCTSQVRSTNKGGWGDFVTQVCSNKHSRFAHHTDDSDDEGWKIQLHWVRFSSWLVHSAHSCHPLFIGPHHNSALRQATQIHTLVAATLISLTEVLLILLLLLLLNPQKVVFLPRTQIAHTLK